MDHFATEANALQYVALILDSEAVVISAMTLDWNVWSQFIFSLVKILKKVFLKLMCF